MAEILNLYPNLPGILTEFKDGGLQLRTDPNPPQTESLLLLGTAVDGPVGVPVAVDSTTYELVFGKAVTNGRRNGATLPVAFEEAWNAGCRDIRLMRISGKPAGAFAACEPVAVQKEQLVEENLGLAPGNSELIVNLATEFTLGAGDSIVEGSVMVQASGYTLPSTAYTADYEAQTVTIHADTCMPGAVITIYASVLRSGESEPENVSCTAEAPGEDKTYTLQDIPVADSFVLYAGSDPVDEASYTLSGNSLTLPAGAILPGTPLKARYMVLIVEQVQNKGLRIQTVNAGTLYNQSKYYVVALSGGTKVLKLEKPESKKSSAGEVLEYSSLDYPTLEALANAINSDTNNGLFYAEVDPEVAGESSALLQVTDPAGVAFTGGNDGVGLTRIEMYELLGGKRDTAGNLVEPGAYQLLENYTVDWIVPLGVYADDELPDPKKNFAQQLAMACAYISVRQHTTYGVIATRPPTSATLKGIDEHVTKLLSRKNDYFVLDKFGDPILDKEGKPFDIGQYIHVLAGPDVALSNTRLGTYAENSAAVFAAMMTTLRPGSSPLNKQVPGVRSLRFTYSNTQRDRLTAARYVTYKTKANGTIVAVEDSMTCAQAGSDYTRTTTVRAVKAAVDATKDACEPFLGEPNNIPNRNAMAAAIDKRLSRMKEAGDINDYRFNIIATLADQVLGRAKVELTLVPPFELRQITVVVNLTPEL